MRHLESDEQKKVFQWAANSLGRYPELRFMFHIPNGGKRNIATAARLKAEGVKAGVPDIFLPLPTFFSNGLFIEMKAAKGTLQSNQKEWLDYLQKKGYQCNVCYGYEDAVKVIEEYLKQVAKGL